jgi:hypothetical protein
LIAQDAVGCSDTVSKPVTVVRPQYNVLLQSLICTKANGYMQYTTTLLNQSNIVLEEIDWRAGLDNTLQLFETWSGTLAPGQFLPYTFTGHVLITPDAEICCAEVQRVQSVLGDSMISRRICVPLIQDFSVLDAYPNPTGSDVNIFYVLPTDGDVQVRISDHAGRIIETFQLAGSDGVNLFHKDLTRYPAGTYHFSFYYRDEVITKKVVKYE